MSTLKLAEHTEEILKLYDSGMSRADIARRYTCYDQPVTTLIKKYRTLPTNGRAGNINSSYFSVIDSHIKAYFVGFIAGDGALVPGKGSTITLTITLNERDDVILEKLREELCMSRPIWRFISHGKFNHARLVTSDKGIVSDLINLGITPRKSLTMPNIICNIPKEFRNSFILGLFDADGSCTVRNATWKQSRKGITNTYSGIKQAVQIRATEDMCKGIVSQLGIKSFHINYSASIPGLAISSKSEFIKFFHLIYRDCSFFLQRKYNKFLPIVNQDQTISSSSYTTEELGARVPIIA